jgi:hypothetical protein
MWRGKLAATREYRMSNRSAVPRRRFSRRLWRVPRQQSETGTPAWQSPPDARHLRRGAGLYKSIAAAPTGFPNALAQCSSANLDRGSKAAQVRKGRGFSLRPNESSDLDSPAQHHDLIACLDLVQQAAQALARFPDAKPACTHAFAPCAPEEYTKTSPPAQEREECGARGAA